MEKSVLDSKGRLLIPKRIRDKYGIKSGMKVAFEEMDDYVIIRPINEQYFKLFKGILKSTGNLKKEMKKMKDEEKRLEERNCNLTFSNGNKKRAIINSKHRRN